MNKSDLILKYFQKAGKLTVNDKEYFRSLTQLFHWLTSSDDIENDKSSKYLPDIPCTAVIISKDNGIIAGLEEIEYLLKTKTKLSLLSQFADGDKIKKGDAIAKITGKSHEILSYERTILNILQRMSGIATETKHLTNIIAGDAREGIPNGAQNIGFEHHLGIPERQDPQIKLFIAATRKTPWMMLDKKAVAVGGGLTHRLSLSDMVLIKDNHLVLIKKENRLRTDDEAIEKVLETFFGRSDLVRGPTSLIEIEVKNEKQAYAAINTYNKLLTRNSQLITHNHLAIMFDNFSPLQAKKLLEKLNDKDKSKIIFEASGGITEENIMEWAKTGVDIISLGSLTHSTHAFNLSLEIIS